jgi:hypothetical protein
MSASGTITSGGAMTVGNGLSVTGGITATGNITAYFSDERLKKKLGTHGCGGQTAMLCLLIYAVT